MTQILLGLIEDPAKKTMDHQDQTHYSYNPAYPVIGASAPTPPAPVAADYDDDDALSDYSSSGESLRKPSNTFDVSAEDVSPRYLKRRSWWSSMVVRARRKNDMEESKEGSAEGLLASEGLLPELYARRISRRRRSFYNYCIFGGISGLSVM